MDTQSSTPQTSQIGYLLTEVMTSPAHLHQRFGYRRALRHATGVPCWSSRVSSRSMQLVQIRHSRDRFFSKKKRASTSNWCQQTPPPNLGLTVGHHCPVVVVPSLTNAFPVRAKTVGPGSTYVSRAEPVRRTGRQKNKQCFAKKNKRFYFKMFYFFPNSFDSKTMS